jgi:hypothetical protein
VTTNTDYLALIKATIDTQYDLARIEIFRPLEIYDRFHGIKAKDFLCGCAPDFESKEADVESSDAEWDALLDRAAPMVAVMDPRRSAIFTIYTNTATLSCRHRADRIKITRHSVRVSVPWLGRTLMREYLLPEVAK